MRGPLDFCNQSTMSPRAHFWPTVPLVDDAAFRFAGGGVIGG